MFGVCSEGVYQREFLMSCKSDATHSVSEGEIPGHVSVRAACHKSECEVTCL